MAIAKGDGDFRFGTTTATPVGLLSYPYVWEPRLNELSGKTKFNCQILVPKKAGILDSLTSEAVKVACDLFGPHINKLSDLGERGCPIKDGDLKDPESTARGHFVISADCAASRRPFVVDKNGRPITDHEEIYGGAIGIMWVQPMAYSMKVGKGVKFVLEGVQKIADGEPFGSSRFMPTGAAPDVPEYLKDRVTEGRRTFTPAVASAAQSMPAHEAALIRSLKETPSAAFVADDEAPF